MTEARRWLFADQLGPHFLDHPGQPALLIESKAVFRRRVFHRQKAHLILSAIRHRAGDDYRNARQRHDILMDGAEPAGNRWNLDADNREPPPRGAERLDVPRRRGSSRTRSTSRCAATSTAGSGRTASSSSAVTVRGCSR